jgi:hypothetical protein
LRVSGTVVDPIVLQVVEGTLASVEAEVEAAIERTSRSPMIREARDFRAGIHDRRCRKLTGRSYSALVQPVVRDFPLEGMEPGDVFFHNDVYGSEGGIGHLPDLCVTVPVFDGGAVVAFVQAFGHHDDIGGAVPGSMPSHATSAYQEGLIVPPVRIYRAAVTSTARWRRAGWAPSGSAISSAATDATRSRPVSTPSSTGPRAPSSASCSPRSPTGPMCGRTTPSTTASIRRAFTPSGWR